MYLFLVNLNAPQFLTAQLLHAVPRVSSEMFKQWVARGHLVLSSADTSGKGRPNLHTAADAVQVAMIRRLAAQGISPGLARMVWEKIGVLLDDWRGGPPAHDRLVLFNFGFEGGLRVIVKHEETFSIQGKKDPEFWTDWSDVQFMIRFDHFVRYVIARLEIVLDPHGSGRKVKAKE